MIPHRSITVLLMFLPGSAASGQGGFSDNRVLVQGFMWESHQDQWKEKWYDHVASKADELAEAEFDLIWLPPPSHGEGAGYHPHELNDFDNNVGDAARTTHACDGHFSHIRTDSIGFLAL